MSFFAFVPCSLMGCIVLAQDTPEFLLLCLNFFVFFSTGYV